MINCDYLVTVMLKACTNNDIFLINNFENRYVNFPLEQQRQTYLKVYKVTAQIMKKYIL